MSINDQPAPQQPTQPTHPMPPWLQPGAGGPSGPGWTAAPAGQQGEPPRPPRRHRRVLAGVVAAGVAFAAGAGATAWAVGVPGSTLGGALSHRTLSTASIVRMTDPAVVDIVSTLGDQGGAAAGTGIVLTSSGEILTNNHVIDGATSIRVTDIGNGRTYSASVTGYDATRDIAVLKLSGASGLKTATIGDSSAVKVGSKVVGIGNAGGKGGLPSVAAGNVTGLGKSITAVDAGSGSSERLTNVIRTNADIQAGDSGGPLLNTAGEVVGIDTAASTSQSQAQAAGVTQAFAIPINRAISIANQIESGTASATVHLGATAFLGVGVSSQGLPGSSTTGSGAAVAGVEQGSAAAGAGIVTGDVITSIGGQAVSSPTALRDALISHHPGGTVSVGWTDQSGQQHSANVVLGSGPAA
jgi:S1-C subfamily serine protease